MDELKGFNRHHFDGSILSKTIRDLHSIHTFSGTNDAYESLLRETIDNIGLLLNYHEKLFKTVELSSSGSHQHVDLGSLKFIYYVNKSTVGNEQHHESQDSSDSIIRPHSLLKYLNKYPHQSSDSISSQLIEVLAANSNSSSSSGSKSGKRLTQSYSVVLTKFSALLDFFIRLHRESEKRLVEYLNKLFNYEARFYSTLNSRLDSDLNINHEDTVQIVNSLDNIIASSNNRQATKIENDKDDSMFVIESTGDIPHSRFEPHTNELVKFTSNDPTFNSLYQIFLQLCSFKTQPDESSLNSTSHVHDYREYIRIMIETYKKQVGTDFLELNDYSVKDLKFNYFYEKFLSSDQEDSIFPILYKSITDKVAREVDLFPESVTSNRFNSNFNGHDHQAETKLEDSNRSHNIGSTSYKQENDSRSSMIPNDSSLFAVTRELSARDQGELINGLRLVIPQLQNYYEFDPIFPDIMRHFVRLLYNSTSGIFIDETENFQYVGSILGLLNTVIDYENDELDENHNIQETINDLYRLHLTLSPSHFGDLTTPGRTLLMRLAIAEFTNSHKICLKYFTKWNNKTLVVNQLQYLLVNSWSDQLKRLKVEEHLKIWYKKYKINQTLMMATENDYNTRLLSKTFTDKWMKRTIDSSNLVVRASRFELLQKWKTWTRRWERLDHLTKESVSYYESTILQKYFDKLIVIYSRRRQMNDLGEEFRISSSKMVDAKVKRLVWNTWYKRMNKTFTNDDESLKISQLRERVSELNIIPLKAKLDSITPIDLVQKLRKLEGLEKYFIYSRYFSLWRRFSQYHLKSQQLRVTNDSILLKYYLVCKWKRQYDLKKLADIEVNKVNEVLLLNAFENWRDTTRLHSKSTEFSEGRITKKWFRLWRLNSKLSQHKHKSVITSDSCSNFNMKNCYKKWHLLAVLKQYQAEREFTKLRGYCNKWQIRALKNTRLEKMAIEYETKRIINTNFIVWMEKYLEKEVDLRNTADDFVQRKFLTKMAKRLLKIRQNQQRSKKYLSSSSYTFSERTSLLSCLRIWQNLYGEQFEKNNQKKVEVFVKNVSNSGLLYKFLERWAVKYNANQRKTDKLKQLSDKFLWNSLLMHSTLGKWKLNTTRKLEQQIEADLFEQKLLLKKHLVRWYDKFIYISESLVERSEDYLNQKDIQKAKELLNIWSMRYIKDIQLQQSRCEMFITRWQISKGKATLDVWLHKARNKKAVAEDDDGEVADMDTSLTSNQSPLSRKVNTSQLSYLNTPIKKREYVGRLPSTPNASRVSPTKLQETSERIKSERVDKLIKHYQKAKGARVSQLNSSFVKLSPERKGSTYANIVPPRPPNFRRSSSRLPEMSSDDESESVFNPNADEEKSTIETAKSLRKITPIFIPTVDEYEAPKFSTGRKLKERIQLTSTPSK
ncbi:hypothetical protein CLIB1423_20S01882 [[Candida] railenensis]|uniref:Sfi1 spindle body domain-containing protein n=1 Tax=[Candida] railenensis TaxID=45579 RepID=A0A9P0QU23_9ASCO|nr:hypothetical protein CLIB1423_20S01882 [[Candida] railenensis]